MGFSSGLASTLQEAPRSRLAVLSVQRNVLALSRDQRADSLSPSDAVWDIRFLLVREAPDSDLPELHTTPWSDARRVDAADRRLGRFSCATGRGVEMDVDTLLSQQYSGGNAGARPDLFTHARAGGPWRKKKVVELSVFTQVLYSLPFKGGLSMKSSSSASQRRQAVSGVNC